VIPQTPNQVAQTAAQVTHAIWTVDTLAGISDGPDSGDRYRTTRALQANLGRQAETAIQPMWQATNCSGSSVAAEVTGTETKLAHYNHRV
jgi:hypothetical protein